jgi:hypothetical protein
MKNPISAPCGKISYYRCIRGISYLYNITAPVMQVPATSRKDARKDAALLDHGFRIVRSR